jgi:hypothetical protein
MLPTVEEFNQTTVSNYEKHFFALCLERKIHDWTNIYGLGGFKTHIPSKMEKCPQDLTIDIIYKEEEDND